MTVEGTAYKPLQAIHKVSRGFIALPGHHWSVMVAKTMRIGNLVQCKILQGNGVLLT